MPSESSINDRIKEIMIKENLNYLSFGKILGFSDVVVGNIIKGRNKPSFDFIKKISLTFDWINLEWLLTGKGSMIKEASASTAPEKEKDELLARLKDKEKLIKILEENKDLLEYKLQVLEKRVAELEQQNTPAVKTKGKATTV